MRPQSQNSLFRFSGYRISESESPKLPWQRALPHWLQRPAHCPCYHWHYIANSPNIFSCNSAFKGSMNDIFRRDDFQWAQYRKGYYQFFWNSPGGVRPQRGGEGRQLSTAQSSFPLKLQLCTATTRPSSSLPVWQPCTATRLDPVVHHGRSGNPAPCNQTLHQGLESPAGPSWGSAIAGFADWPVRTLLQEGMPGHSTLF